MGRTGERERERWWGEGERLERGGGGGELLLGLPCGAQARPQPFATLQPTELSLQPLPQRVLLTARASSARSIHPTFIKPAGDLSWGPGPRGHSVHQRTIPHPRGLAGSSCPPPSPKQPRRPLVLQWAAQEWAYLPGQQQAQPPRSRPAGKIQGSFLTHSRD